MNLVNMLNTLAAKYKIHPFVPKEDEILSLIAKLDITTNQQYYSGIKIIPEDDFLKMKKQDYLEWANVVDAKSDALVIEYDLIKSETLKYISLLKQAYLEDFDWELVKGYKVSLKDLNYHLGAIVLALNRLYLVQNPEYSYTVAKHSRSKIEYDMIKGYWYMDDGEKLRTISRSIGSTIHSVDILSCKMLENFGYETFIPNHPIGNNIQVDFVVIKDNKKWIANSSIKERKSYIKTFVSMELWKIFKEIYLK